MQYHFDRAEELTGIQNRQSISLYSIRLIEEPSDHIDLSRTECLLLLLSRKRTQARDYHDPQRIS